MIREEKRYDKVSDLEYLHRHHEGWFDFKEYEKAMMLGSEVINDFFHHNNNCFLGSIFEDFDIEYAIEPDRIYDVFYCVKYNSSLDVWKELTFLREHEDRFVIWMEFPYMSNCSENYSSIQKEKKKLADNGKDWLIKAFHNETLVTSDMSWEEFHTAVHGHPPGVGFEDDLDEYRKLLERTRVIGNVKGSPVCTETNLKCPVCGGRLIPRSIQFPKMKGTYELDDLGRNRWVYHLDCNKKIKFRSIRFECEGCGTEVGVNFDNYSVYEVK